MANAFLVFQSGVWIPAPSQLPILVIAAATPEEAARILGGELGKDGRVHVSREKFISTPDGQYLEHRVGKWVLLRAKSKDPELPTIELHEVPLVEEPFIKE